eukprot:28912-Rhodomonas_salina.4
MMSWFHHRLRQHRTWTSGDIGSKESKPAETAPSSRTDPGSSRTQLSAGHGAANARARTLPWTPCQAVRSALRPHRS